MESLSSFIRITGGFLFLVCATLSLHSLAYAEQDLEISTPAIRAIGESMKVRANKLVTFLDSGSVGLSTNGLLKLRDTTGLTLESLAQLNRLVSAENTDRLQLCREIAQANGSPDQAEEIQEMLAETWRKQAKSGWYIQLTDGTWARKQ